MGIETFTNGHVFVDFYASPELLEHARNYFAPDPGCQLPSSAPRWKVTARLGTGSDPVPCTNWSLVKGEYGEALARCPSGCHLVSLVSGSRIRIDAKARSIDVHGTSLQGVYMEAYRAVRQILLRTLLHQGAVVMHASAVAAADGVTVCVGKKGAGKTTAAWQSLHAAQGGLRFVANDRVLLTPGNSGIAVYGWPATAFVGLGTISSTFGVKRLVGLHDRCSGTARLMTDHRLTEADVLDFYGSVQVTEHLASHKLYLLPGEVAQATESGLAWGGPLKRIVFPEFQHDGDEHSARIQQLRPADAMPILAAEVLGEGLGYPDTLGLSGPWNTDRVETLAPALSKIQLLGVRGRALSAWLEQ